jgi:hypothetical protein
LTTCVVLMLTTAGLSCSAKSAKFGACTTGIGLGLDSAQKGASRAPDDGPIISPMAITRKSSTLGQ